MRKKIVRRQKEIQNERGTGVIGRIRRRVANAEIEVKQRRKRK